MGDRMLNRREMLGAMGAAAALTTIPVSLRAAGEPAVDFLVVGDWGRNGASHQREVAAQMAKTGENLTSRFVISVGDNFYENGVQSADDPQWRSSYEDIYSARALQIPWFVALGNHDYRGVPQAQMDYAKTSARWRMPGRYYKISGRDVGASHLDLFIIDTSPMVHKYRDNVHEAIAANVAGQDVPAQLQWLDRALTESNAPWKVVVGHHTIYSGGSGHGDTREAKELLVPIFRKHGVQAYINGHDHDLQHIRRDGIDYVCCGAGSEVRPVQSVDGTLFCAERSGFAAMRSTADSLTFEFRDFTGVKLYQSAVLRSSSGAGRPV